MPVQLRFYAPYHLLAGTTTGELESPTPFPVKDLPTLLLEAYPGLGHFMADPELACHLRAFREGAILNPDDLVKDGDQLQLMAPFMAG